MLLSKAGQMRQMGPFYLIGGTDLVMRRNELPEGGTMTKDIEWAFGSAIDRVDAVATRPLDRIAVRDFLKTVEIGAFQLERGVTQRVKFNVVLEVLGSDAAETDDVDQVLSYDTIIEAIEHQLATERLNLLETLAERIADEILVHAQAVRAFVRIEKLDRIPGTLGVEIVRTRNDADAVADLGEVIPRVVFMPNKVMHAATLSKWLDALADQDKPAIICLEKAANPLPRADHTAADRRIGLLAMEQNAWVLAGKDARCVVVNSRTELDWAMKQGHMSVWAPSKMVLDAVEAPSADANDPLGLCRWLADEFGATGVVVLGKDEIAPASETLRHAQTPDAV
jgi:dihydroneopterin aldolase